MSNFASAKPVFLNNLRAAWLDIYEPGEGMNGGAPKFKFTGLMEPGSEAVATAKKAMLEAATELWGKNAIEVIKAMAANSKALRDGNNKLNDDGSVRAEYAGMMYVSASAKEDEAPLIVGPKRINGQFVQIHADGSCSIGGRKAEPPYPIKPPYRGCYVNAKVVFTAGKSFKGKNGEIIPNQIFARFEALQFVRDGEAFGKGPRSAEGFGDEEVAEFAVTGDDPFADN